MPLRPGWRPPRAARVRWRRISPARTCRRISRRICLAGCAAFTPALRVAPFRDRATGMRLARWRLQSYGIRVVKRATFQIGPTAKFTAGRPYSKLDALAERLFGRTRGGQTKLGMPPGLPIAPARLFAPSAAPLKSVRRRNLNSSHHAATDAAAQAAPGRRPRRPPAHRAGNRAAHNGPRCEYRGYVISTVQRPDEARAPDYVRQGDGQGGIDPVPLPRRYPTTYLARFLAVADAELEIDELVDPRGR